MTLLTPTDSRYYIKPRAVSFAENDLGDVNRVYVSIASGTTIMVYVPEDNLIPYDDDKEYQKWVLTGYPTKLATSDAYYIYARLSRSDNSAIILFSTKKYKVDGSIEGEEGGGNASGNYYYIPVGNVTATDGATLRTLSFDSGKLSTPDNSYTKEQADAQFMSFEVADKRYLNALDDDEASGLIRFLKGLYLGESGNPISSVITAENAEDSTLYTENALLSAAAFSKLFSIAKDDKGNSYIRTPYPLASDSTVSSLGVGEDEGGTGGTAALYQLVDVLRDGDKVSGAEDGNVLMYDAATGKWYGKKVNIPEVDFSDINDKFVSIDGLIRSLQEKDVAHDESITALQTKDAAIEQSIASLQSKDTEHSNAIAALQTKDTAIEQSVTSLQGQFDTLVSGDASSAIESFNEVVEFLKDIEDDSTLEGILAGKQNKITETNKLDYSLIANTPSLADFMGSSAIGGTASSENFSAVYWDGTQWKTRTIYKWALASVKPSYTTSDVTEGTRLYFTDDRAKTALKSTTDALSARIAVFEKMFQWGDGDGSHIKTPYAFASDKTVSSLGVGSDGAGGVSYDRLDSWDSYTADKAGYVLSAALGLDLKTRLDNLDIGDFDLSGYLTKSEAENTYATIRSLNSGLARKQETITDLATIREGAALGATALQSSDLDGYVNEIATSGSGNAITSVTKSGKKLTFNKASSFFLAGNFTKANIKSTLGISDWALASSKPSYKTSEVTEEGNLYFTTDRVKNCLTGAISTVLTSNLTASRALISNASGKIAVSAVTSTELGYLDGVTSAVQTQLNALSSRIKAYEDILKIEENNTLLHATVAFASDSTVSSLGVGSDDEGNIGGVIDLTNVVTNIVPSMDGLNIGSASSRWSKLYVTRIENSQDDLSLDSSGYIRMLTDVVFGNNDNFSISPTGTAYLGNIYSNGNIVATIGDIDSKLSGYALKSEVYSGVISGETENGYYKISLSYGNGVGTNALIPSYSALGFTNIEQAEGYYLADQFLINDILDYVDNAVKNVNVNVDLSNYYTKTQVHTYVSQELNTFSEENLGTALQNYFPLSGNKTITGKVTISSAGLLEVQGNVYVGGKLYSGLSNNNPYATQDWVESQGYTSNIGTVTGVRINGSTKNPSSGIVDLGYVASYEAIADVVEDYLTYDYSLSSDTTDAVKLTTLSGRSQSITAATLKNSLGLKALAYKDSIDLSAYAKTSQLENYYTKDAADSAFAKVEEIETLVADEIGLYLPNNFSVASNTTNVVSVTIGSNTENISAATLKTSLGLGEAAYKAVGAVASGNTGLVTGGSVYTAIKNVSDIVTTINDNYASVDYVDSEIETLEGDLAAFITATEVDTKLQSYATKATTLAGYGITDGLPFKYIGETNLNTVYDAGMYTIRGVGSNFPSSAAYGIFMVFPYRKGFGNTKPDYAAQLYFPDGGDASKNMYFRLSHSTSWSEWHTVLDDKNFSSYALPLTGGEIKGSLGVTVNITAQGGTFANGLKVGGNDVIHSGNIGSQSVNYATSAGSASNATKWNGFKYYNEASDDYNIKPYFKLVTIRIKSGYTNSVVSFDVSGRSKGVAHIEVYPSGSSSIGGAYVSRVEVTGNSLFADKIRAYTIGNETDSSGNIIAKVIEVWYTKQQQSYDSVVVQNVHWGRNESVEVNCGIYSSLPTSYESYVDATIGSIYGNLSGNASSATKLSTARTIWGQSFDGSGNVSGDLYLSGSFIRGYDGYSLIEATSSSVHIGYGYQLRNLPVVLWGKPIYFVSSGSYDMAIATSGNVLIGTTTDSGKGKLQVNGGVALNNIEFFPSTSAGHGGYIDFHYNGSTSDYTSRFIEDSSGSLCFYADYGRFKGAVTIGSTSNLAGTNGYKLYVNGNSYVNGTLNIGNESSANITLHRNSANYIWAVNSGGYLVLGVQDVGATGSQNASLMITGSSVTPGARNNAVSLGSANYRWSNIYSVNGNFSGSLTVSGGITMGGNAVATQTWVQNQGYATQTSVNNSLGSLSAEISAVDARIDALGTAAKKNWSGASSADTTNLVTIGWVESKLGGYATAASIPTKTSQLTNDSNFLSGHIETTVIGGGTGLVTGGAVYSFVEGSLSGYAKKATTLSGYGITDALPKSNPSVTGTLTVAGNVLPSNNNDTYALGSANYRWSKLYTNGVDCTGVISSMTNISARENVTAINGGLSGKTLSVSGAASVGSLTVGGVAITGNGGGSFNGGTVGGETIFGCVGSKWTHTKCILVVYLELRDSLTHGVVLLATVGRLWILVTLFSSHVIQHLTTTSKPSSKMYGFHLVRWLMLRWCSLIGRTNQTANTTLAR